MPCRHDHRHSTLLLIPNGPDVAENGRTRNGNTQSRPKRTDEFWSRDGAERHTVQTREFHSTRESKNCKNKRLNRLAEAETLGLY